MNITFETPAEVTVTPAVTFTATEVKILSITDSPESETVTVRIAASDDADDNNVAKIVLWEGEDYATVAEFAWTLASVEQRLRALLSEG